MKGSTNKAASDYTGPERRQAPTMDAIELVFERMLRKHEAREDALWEERLQRLVPNGDFDGATRLIEEIGRPELFMINCHCTAEDEAKTRAFIERFSS